VFRDLRGTESRLQPEEIRWDRACGEVPGTSDLEGFRRLKPVLHAWSEAHWIVGRVPTSKTWVRNGVGRGRGPCAFRDLRGTESRL
jgi:hypothetical protein